MVIYITTNLVNGKKYIGRDSHNNPNYYGSGPAIKNAIKKYGKQNFKKEIIEECSSFEKLIEREEYWLNYYDAANNRTFYNLQNAGKGTQHTDLTKRKISKTLCGRKLTKEHRDKIGNSTRGEKSSWYGRKHTDDTKDKISKAKMGKKLSSDAKTKLSKSHLGERNGMYGKFDENSHSFKGYVTCISGSYCGQTKSIKEWCDVLNRQSGHFSLHLSGKCYKNGIKGNFFKREF
jgi:group I intron endonuclease